MIPSSTWMSGPPIRPSTLENTIDPNRSADSLVFALLTKTRTSTSSSISRIVTEGRRLCDISILFSSPASTTAATPVYPLMTAFTRPVLARMLINLSASPVSTASGPWITTPYR